MNTLREAAQQVIAAWKACHGYPDTTGDLQAIEQSITALRAELAESERDWSLLEATQESLREHMAEIRRLRALLAEPQEPVAEGVKQQALDALNRMQSILMMSDGRHPRDVLRAYIQLTAAPPQPKAEPQEPVELVVWISKGGLRELRETGRSEVFAEKDYECLGTLPLYAAPQPRKRLSDREIADLWSWSMTAEAERTANTQQHAFARAIEAAVWGDGK